MTTSFKVIAIVPALNESKTVGAVVSSLRSFVDEVIVVDDASSDATSEVAGAAGAVVLRNDTSRGYDGSIDLGFGEAARRGAEIFVTFDADGEHDAADMPRILAPILNDTADVVAGQRPRIRHWGEFMFSLVSRIRFGIRDPLCGFKAYRRSVYDRVGFFDSKKSIGTELMARGKGLGFRLAAVPITLHERQDDASRFYAFNFRGNLRIIAACCRVVML